MPNSIIYLGCSLQLQFLFNISWYKVTPINSNLMHDFFINNDIQNNNT